MRRSRLFECIFAFSLAARRRSSRYGAVRRKVKRLLAISDLMQAAVSSASVLRLLPERCLAQAVSLYEKRTGAVALCTSR